ncbi:response regulator transcription factor [Emcibacter sp.]|uniref:response regulator transcription factor n=1 Tax=Emcibacter sp. TaxID=1979954 RepID=UPI003A8E3753
MRLLLVEDDKDLSRQMKAILEDGGYAVDTSFDGEDGHFLGETESYDAIILDLGLPVIDGLSVLRKWRNHGVETPVLVLTARDEWSEKVAGLDAGADDYVTKPFKVEEVLARVRALIRRAAGKASPELSCGTVTLNTSTSRVTVGGSPVKLTAQEYKLLSYMMHHPEKVISRTELTEHIYDQDFDRDSNTIEVFVTRIRKKLGVNILKTIRGMGYQLVEPEDEQVNEE